jgi:predicted permease
VDPTALAATIGLTTLAGLACGLLPALKLSRGGQNVAMGDATHQRSGGRSTAIARNTLVVAEVALASVLLVGAGLLFRSFDALLQVNLGFEPQHAMAWRVDTPRRFKSGAEAEGYFGAALRRVAALPGVSSVGLSDTLPLSRNRSWGAGAVGVQYPEGQYPDAYPRIIDARYLQTMRIPLLAGRYFDESHDPQAEKAIIINQSLARRLWPGVEALGRKIDVNGGSTVIGVVADVRHASLEEAGSNEMYLDYRQTGDWSGIEMVVRSSRPLQSLVPEVRAALFAHDPSLPNGEFYELDRLVDNAVGPRRLVTRLLGFFSALALTLAALGLYGVIAYSVTQRRQEIGIRLAVGAQRSDVLRLVVADGLKLVAIGIVLGLAGAFALTRLLQSMLFGVTAHDPLVFAGNAALLLAVALAACALPALRASRVDPMSTLRTD